MTTVINCVANHPKILVGCHNKYLFLIHGFGISKDDFTLGLDAGIFHASAHSGKVLSGACSFHDEGHEHKRSSQIAQEYF